jgi:hypothetical protein
MNKDMDKPYLMHKRTFGFCPNLPEIAKQHEGELIPINAEQAERLSKEGPKAGIAIMRAIVAADNAAALAEAEARFAEPEPAKDAAESAPVPEAPAEPAEVPLKDLPLAELREMAKRDGGFPDGKDVDKASRRELVALLQP